MSKPTTMNRVLSNIFISYMGGASFLCHAKGPWRFFQGWFTPWSRTMEDGLIPWSNLIVQLPKPLGPSLGVNQMWIKRNDMHPKMSMLIYFWGVYAQKGQFWIFFKQKKNKIDPSLVFSCIFLSSSSLLPKKKSFRIKYNNISLPWAPAFFY